MSKKNKVIISIVTLIIILLGNTFSGTINLFTEGTIRTYHYQTFNGEFEALTIPSKGHSQESMEKSFTNFKKENPDYTNLTLYRTYKRNWFKFWNWYNYLSNPKYTDYPYTKKLNEEN